MLILAASAGGMIEPLWHESVSSTFHFPLILPAHRFTQSVHRVSRTLDVLGVDVVRSQIRLSVMNETMSREVDQDAIVILGDSSAAILRSRLRRFARVARLPIRRWTFSARKLPPSGLIRTE